MTVWSDEVRRHHPAAVLVKLKFGGRDGRHVVMSGPGSDAVQLGRACTAYRAWLEAGRKLGIGVHS